MNPELIQLRNLYMILLSIKLDFLLTSFMLGLDSYFLLQGTLEKLKKRIILFWVIGNFGNIKFLGYLSGNSLKWNNFFFPQQIETTYFLQSNRVCIWHQISDSSNLSRLSANYWKKSFHLFSIFLLEILFIAQGVLGDWGLAIQLVIGISEKNLLLSVQASQMKLNI